MTDDQKAEPGTLRVNGGSDDLIEIHGMISEEFKAYGGDGYVLGFSDGTVLRIIYTPQGIWRITPVEPGAAVLHIEQAPEGDDENYSDVAILGGHPITWVTCGTDLAQARK